MKIGIIGAGSIAGTMAQTLSGMGDKAEKYAIASRTQSKADEFAKKWGFEKAYGSYEDLVADPKVELIYIATPHSEHAANTMLCINAGKPALVEKSFTKNIQEAKAVLDAAEKKGVLVTEAIWPRYMPSRKLIDEVIASEIVGKPVYLTANLHYKITHKKRIMEPSLAGGALLDVGVYAVNFALMHFGDQIERVASDCAFTDTGVDSSDSITMYYKDAKVAQLTAGINGRSDRKGIIYCENGYIIVENINNPNLIQVFDDNDKLLKTVEVPEQITGYEYEVLEAMDCIEKGLIECPSMPHGETIKMMEMMDSMLKDWGINY